MEDPVVPFDLVRMFIGTEPLSFYMEILVRTCIVYAYALALIRWVGGRGIAQMSTVEFLLVIALGSAVGDAMFYPEVPLFHAMMVITAIVVINKGLDILIFRFQAVEKAIDGHTAEVIRDGVIVKDTLRAAKIGTSELFEGLRQAGFGNLGEVRRAYLESSGSFSIFRSDKPRPGLAVEPAWDVSRPQVLKPGTCLQRGEDIVCCECGMPKSGVQIVPEKCTACGGNAWTVATEPDTQKP